MNIFFLDLDPVKSAQAHGDKHVVKMPLEAAQMLCTVWHHYGTDNLTRDFLYKPTHLSHPCTQWVAANASNYEWTFCYYRALCEEFEYRRGKSHASLILSEHLAEIPGGVNAGDFFAPPQCLPTRFQTSIIQTISDESKPTQIEATCFAYRQYYQYKFDTGIVTYNWKRSKPDWLVDHVSL